MKAKVVRDLSTKSIRPKPIKAGILETNYYNN